MNGDHDPPAELICLPFPEAMALWLSMCGPGDADPARDLRRLQTLSVAFVLLGFSVLALLAWIGAA